MSQKNNRLRNSSQIKTLADHDSEKAALLANRLTPTDDLIVISIGRGLLWVKVSVGGLRDKRTIALHDRGWSWNSAVL
ncbi:MAG: hypothetical protein ACYT04_80305 [Nostoc sp.]